MKKLDTYFKTSELALVSFLRTQGYSIEHTERFGKQVIFYVEEDNKLKQLIKDFWSHSLMVEPLAFFNSIKETKSFIYQ
jgi:hypothetical protein